MTIIDAFDGDIRRLLSFAWGMESCNPYPPGVEARLSESDHPDDEKLTEGETIPDPLTALQGLTQQERRMQASQIRGRLKLVLDRSTMAVLALKWIVPYDKESTGRKWEAYTRVVKDMIMTTTFTADQIKSACKHFGKISDKKPHGGAHKQISELYLCALDMAEHRLNHNI